MFFDVVVFGLLLAVALGGTAAGFTLAARRWRDQSVSSTLAQLGIGAFVGLFAGMLLLAALNQVAALAFFTPAWFLVWTIGLLAAAAWTCVRDARERRASCELAIAAGMDPLEAARLNRRPLLGNAGLAAIYFAATTLWLCLIAAAAYAQAHLEHIDEPPWLSRPQFWTDARADGVVWWLLVMAGIVFLGLIHAAVNYARRGLGR